MEYILRDFVNRTELISLLWQMAREEIETRILLMEGADGIGKSYLIKEFQAECQEEKLNVVRLDFADRYEDPGYLYVVREIWSQLGMDGFQVLSETISQISNQVSPVQIQSPSMTPTDTRVHLGALPSTRSAPSNGGNSIEQGGGVNITGGTNVFQGDVAGRDIIHLIQIIQREDPFVHAQAQISITDALRQCLMQIAERQRIIVLIDHWQGADGETRRWLARSLVKWAADLLLPKISVVIAGSQVGDLDPRRLIKKVNLHELSEETARLYLLEKCGLSEGDVPEIIHVAGGLPLMLAMAAARRRRLAAL